MANRGILPGMLHAATAIAEPTDAPLSLSRAARVCTELHLDGRPPSVAAMSRWASRGRLSVTGRRVRLRTWRVGGRLATSRAAVAEFLAALNNEATPYGIDPHDDIDAELDVTLG